MGVVLLGNQIDWRPTRHPSQSVLCDHQQAHWKIHCFDEFQAAQSYFDDEASYCRQTLHSQDRRYAQTIEIGPDPTQKKRA